ncbi:MAG: hypothetical protein WC631_01410 [Candidatus Paceibacterota bacterium]
MEIFFTYLQRAGSENLTQTYLEGKTRPCFSCEIVSLGGAVHFYIWMSQAKFKNIIEAQLYAQYPNIEIYEVKEDYTNKVFFDEEKYPMFGRQHRLSKPDAYPIKTYIDYGLDKDQEEEYKIDPLTPIVEYMGTLKKGEYAWLQILIQKHEEETLFHGRLTKEREWVKDIDKEIKKVRESAMQGSGDEENKFRFPNPTKGQNEIIAALERSKGKMAFDCMIRSVYIAEKASFTPANISGLTGCLRQYGSNLLNRFGTSHNTGTSDVWKDVLTVLPFLKAMEARKVSRLKRDLLHAYKLRSFFEWPYKHLGGSKPFVLTTEELATVFHFPSGIVSQTPTLTRVPSKKSEAPANLPI